MFARAGRMRDALEAFLIPVGALAVTMVLFGAFAAVLGKNPLEVYALIHKGAFASSFSWQNTLSRAAPLILTALCVALPAQAGLMIIGGEGALVLGLRRALLHRGLRARAPHHARLRAARGRRQRARRAPRGPAGERAAAGRLRAGWRRRRPHRHGRSGGGARQRQRLAHGGLR